MDERWPPRGVVMRRSVDGHYGTGIVDWADRSLIAGDIAADVTPHVDGTAGLAAATLHADRGAKIPTDRGPCWVPAVTTSVC